MLVSTLVALMAWTLVLVYLTALFFGVAGYTWPNLSVIATVACIALVASVETDRSGKDDAE